MEVRKGYKQTEIGVIPDDWDVKSIDSITEIIGGGTPNTTIPEYWNGQISWVSAGDVSNANGRYIHSTAFHISELGLASCSTKIMPAGTTIIIARGATVGRMAQLGMAMTFNQTCYGFLPTSGIDKNYLYYSMLYSVKSIRALTYGTTFGAITTNSFGKWNISLPPLSEQHAIATALSDVDSLLTALDSLIAKKRLVKQGAMQELLTGKRRLSGFSGEWEEKKLGDIVEFVNGKPLESIVSSEGDYFLITLDSIDINGKLKPDHKRTSYFDNSLRKGDIVVILSDIAHGYLLGLCDLIPEDNKYLLNQRVGRIRCNDEYVPEFLRLQINRNQEFFRKRGQGTSQRHIYKRDIYELSISLPKKPEQQAIAEILSDMDAEINALESRREKTRQLKAGMMQELLTGRIRLVD